MLVLLIDRSITAFVAKFGKNAANILLEYQIRYCLRKIAQSKRYLDPKSTQLQLRSESSPRVQVVHGLWWHN